MNLPAIWDMIRETRSLPEFREDQLKYYKYGVPMIIPVDPVVYREFYTDFANFYGVPWNVVSEYMSVPSNQQKAADEALWNNVFSPLNAMVPEAFEILKPQDIPGFFNVSFTEPKKPGTQVKEPEQEPIAREHWLFYIEPLIEPPALPGGGSGA